MDRLSITEVIEARGHENIRATHKSTFEITRDPTLTPRGDCIIAVSANKACADLNPQFKSALKSPGARVRIAIRCGEIHTVVLARGSPELILSDPRSIVVRRSSYIDARTLAVKANKAAADLPRALIIRLRRCEKVLLIVTVER